jgi:hypothetical protein
LLQVLERIFSVFIRHDDNFIFDYFFSKTSLLVATSNSLK